MNAIVESINAAGKTFVEFASPMFVQSCLLIVILLAADAVLRRRVRAVFRYWIWMLVLVKLVLPPSLWSPVSVGTWFGDELKAPAVALSEWSEPQAAVPVAETRSIAADVLPKSALAPSVEDRDVPRAGAQGGEVRGAADKEPMPSVTEPSSIQAPGASLRWQGLVLLSWAAVATVLLLLLLQRAFFVRGLVAQADAANAAMQDGLNRCRVRIGLRRGVGLRLSAVAGTPAACGLIRPVILIPQSLAPRLEAHDLEAVLLHELAHVKRGDLWVNLAQTLLQIVYFYNPLLWLANAAIRRTREQAVDEAVLVAMGDAAQQYPETLVNIAKLAFRKRLALSLRLIGVVESKSALSARIKHMLTRPLPKTAKLGGAGLAVIAIVAAVLLPMARARQDEAGELLSRLAVLPNCGVWLSDIAGHDLPVLDLASDEIVNLPGIRNDYELLTTTVAKGKGDILYYYDKVKNTAKITFLRRAGLGGKPASKDSETVTIIPMEMPFETIVATQRGDRFRVRIIHADEQACSIQFHPLNDPRPTFKAILSGGIVAEFLGVYEHPSEGQTWWRPDGMGFLSEAPLEGEYFNRLKGENFDLHPSRKEVVCVAAIRLYHGPDAAMANVSISPSRGEAQAAVDSTRDGNIMRDLCWGATILPQSEKSCAVRCLIMTGPWETVAKVSAKALGDRSVTVNGVTFSAAAEDSNKGAAVAARYDRADRRFTITAVTTDGRTIEAPSQDGSSGPFTEETSGRFPSLTFAEIEEFQLRTRPWRWVEFKNVSLRPGRQTNVEVRDGLGEDRVSQVKVVLPEADRRPVVLDLATGELVPLPGTGPDPNDIQQALRRLGKGDLLYDCDSGDRTLILVRDATSEQAHEDTGEPSIEGYLIGRQLPATLTVTTAEGRRYEVTILAADERSCTLRYSPVSVEPVPEQNAQPQQQDPLKQRMDEALPGATVIVPKGTYTTPIEITKAVVLRGESQEECIIEVTADQPAILVKNVGKGNVTIENLTIRWQLATDKKVELPAAVLVRDEEATIRNCRFVPLGDSTRSPMAVYIDGKSKSTVDNCRFSGFDYAVCYGQGTEGVVQDCIITDCGHQGVINYDGSTLTVQRNIITGSKFHAVRCTGGTLHVKDNLLIRNANRGIYLGNKTGRGTITNNLIIGNGTGVSAFGRADFAIANNVIVDNEYAGIDMRDSCRLSIRNNVLAKSQRGIALHKEGTENFNVIGKNVYWANATDVEAMDKPEGSVTADPQFTDPNHGDFSVQGPVKEQGHGLTNPSVIRELWEKYRQLPGNERVEPAAAKP